MRRYEAQMFSPWKDASRMIAGDDASVAFYVKCIADQTAAGAQVDQATVVIGAAAGVADLITLQIAGGGGALANDAGILYTGQTGGAGVIDTGNGNANSIGEVINIINGVGVGQAQIRRYRAALGDVPPGLALVANDLQAPAVATNILLGETHVGQAVTIDTSVAGLIAADDYWVGIGTDGGTIRGVRGWRMPDYFEDFPGQTTVGGVNTPQRSSAQVPRKAEDATTRMYQYRITGFALSAFRAATESFQVRDIWNNIIWDEPLTAAAAVVFQDRSDNPIVGPVGSPLFCRFYDDAGGALTAGNFQVQAEVRAV